jgi:hypothetical protein
MFWFPVPRVGENGRGKAAGQVFGRIRSASVHEWDPSLRV